jgi:hypothetical protein
VGQREGAAKAERFDADVYVVLNAVAHGAPELVKKLAEEVARADRRMIRDDVLRGLHTGLVELGWEWGGRDSNAKAEELTTELWGLRPTDESLGQEAYISAIASAIDEEISHARELRARRNIRYTKAARAGRPFSRDVTDADDLEGLGWRSVGILRGALRALGLTDEKARNMTAFLEPTRIKPK